MKHATAYLNFDGNTREAFTFYAECLGTEASIMPFPDDASRTLHACVSLNDRPVVMASDCKPGDFQRGNDFSVCLECESVEEIESLFAKFAAGGTVEMPLQDMFWGARFGHLRDRFGVQWMFNCPLQ